jgi:membrane protein required for beta-lactamase induction
MRLIAILLALWANHHPHQIDRWRRPEPFLHYLDWVCARIPGRSDRDSLLQLVAALLPPLLLFAVVQVMLDDWLLGIAEIALGVWALLFLHGSGRADDQLDSFIQAWREGHYGTARNQASELAGRTIDDATSNGQLPLAAMEGLFWQSYRRVLVGIFWLLIIGPVGPVAVRLVALAHESASARSSSFAHYSKALLNLIDWLPSRAAALSFALAGSFVRARQAWQDSQVAGFNARSLVVGTGIGALDADDSPDDADEVEETLREARELVGRSLMVWIAIAALLTIAGWLY